MPDTRNPAKLTPSPAHPQRTHHCVKSQASCGAHVQSDAMRKAANQHPTTLLSKLVTQLRDKSSLFAPITWPRLQLPLLALSPLCPVRRDRDSRAPYIPSPPTKQGLSARKVPHCQGSASGSMFRDEKRRYDGHYETTPPQACVALRPSHVSIRCFEAEVAETIPATGLKTTTYPTSTFRGWPHDIPAPFAKKFSYTSDNRTHPVNMCLLFSSGSPSLKVQYMNRIRNGQITTPTDRHQI
ncbi:uncharacterized protein BDR25DRAFT_352368 [Lindgomyces ingoldianus]|uniref:Uncharacterized protein n=1 Tax=Lindgomyces ingoldianus TaxID=673940 RepID=A0ACB6R5V2_9PLEO|nr:uncharacterized protein BDR25DRAFT_352368 [Lindgomyces ingoldianus]KAF2473907.1 hypothetical protein BDR25DRAFT_352368 [Lindgomyces ingoldianus]